MQATTPRTAVARWVSALMAVLVAGFVLVWVSSGANAVAGVGPNFRVPATHAYDSSVNVYDGAACSLRAHASAAALVASLGGSEGVQGTVATASGPISVLFRISVAADSAAVATTPKVTVKPNFTDPAVAPGAGWEWRGVGNPGSPKGSWYNPTTGESLYPDLAHPGPIGPHYDWKAPDGTTYRVYQDGRVETK